MSTELLEIPQIKRLPNADGYRWQGVYFVLYRNTILYVGQSENVGQRIKYHKWAKGLTIKRLKTGGFTKTKRLNLEFSYICKFQPPMNGYLKTNIVEIILDCFKTTRKTDKKQINMFDNVDRKNEIDKYFNRN